MRPADFLLLPLSALWQQKSRTVLTTLGVVFGSFVLAASLSVGQGVQDLIERESHRSDFLRRINVSPGNPPGQSNKPAEVIAVNGEMTEARRDRLRRAIKEHHDRWTRWAKPTGLLLTRDKLEELAALPHVQDVRPSISGSTATSSSTSVTSRPTCRRPASKTPSFASGWWPADRSTTRTNKVCS